MAVGVGVSGSGEGVVEEKIATAAFVAEGLGVALGAEAAVLLGKKKNAPTIKQPIQKTAATATAITPSNNCLFDCDRDGV